MRAGRAGTAETGAETGRGGPADGVRRGDGHGEGGRGARVLHVARVRPDGRPRVRGRRPGRVRPLPERRPQVPVRPAVHGRPAAVPVRRAGGLRDRGPARRVRAGHAVAAPGARDHRAHDRGRRHRPAAVGRTAGGRGRLPGVRQTAAAPVAGVRLLEARGGPRDRQAGGRRVVSGRRARGAGAVGHGVFGRGHGRHDDHSGRRPKGRRRRRRVLSVQVDRRRPDVDVELVKRADESVGTTL